MAHRRTDSSRRMHILMGPTTPILNDDGHVVQPKFLPSPPMSPSNSPPRLPAAPDAGPEKYSSLSYFPPSPAPSRPPSPPSLSISVSVTSTSPAAAAANPFKLLETLTLTRKRPKYWNRTTLIALALLTLASFYVFLFVQPNFGVRLSYATPPAPPAHMLSAPGRKHKLGLTHPRPLRPQLSLDPTQELAAITSFIVSLPQNVIPHHVDPSRPIDPELVLDFDTRAETAREEMDEIVRDVWSRFPVILFSKYHSAASREVKAILNDMNLRPAPTIIDIDERPDYQTLLALYSRLTVPYISNFNLDDSSDLSTSELDSEASELELPLLLISGNPLSLPQIRSLNDRGELRAMVGKSGAVIGGGRRKKHGRR